MENLKSQKIKSSFIQALSVQDLTPALVKKLDKYVQEQKVKPQK